MRAHKKHSIQAMHNHPKLIERPIVVVGNKARLGRPPEQVTALLSRLNWQLPTLTVWRITKT